MGKYPTSYSRGWKTEYVNDRWRYRDTGEDTSIERPCKRCGSMPTPEGYDACIGYVPKAVSVCCGHGVMVLIRMIKEKAL